MGFIHILYKKGTSLLPDIGTKNVTKKEFIYNTNKIMRPKIPSNGVGINMINQNKKTTTAEKTNKILKATTKDSGSIEGLEKVFQKQNKEAQTMELIVLIKGSKIDGSLQQRLLEQFDVLVIEQADKLIALNVAYQLTVIPH